MQMHVQASTAISRISRIVLQMYFGGVQMSAQLAKMKVSDVAHSSSYGQRKLICIRKSHVDVFAYIYQV